MIISKALQRALDVLPVPARAMIPRIRSSFASGSRVAQDAAIVSPLRLPRVLQEVTLMKAGQSIACEICELTAEHAQLVRDLYARQGERTFAEAHGSLCAFHSGLFGQTREEAEHEMMCRFLHVVSPDSAPRSACIGLRVKGGDLIGLALLEGVRGRPLVCRTHSLVIDDEHHRLGAATLLKRGQLGFAAAQGFEEALTFLYIPEMKWLKAGEQPPVIKVLQRAACGVYESKGPVAVDDHSMVISTKLKRREVGA